MVWVFGIGTGFDLTTRDSYFMILVDKPYFSKRHMFHESYTNEQNTSLWS